MVAKNQKQHNFFLVVFLAVALLIVGFLAVQNISMYKKRQELSKTAADLKAKIQDLEQQNSQIEASIQTNQGTEYQEKALREQGLYKKSGEQVITVLPPSQTQQVQSAQQTKVWWNPDTWFR